MEKDMIADFAMRLNAKGSPCFEGNFRDVRLLEGTGRL